MHRAYRALSHDDRECRCKSITYMSFRCGQDEEARAELHAIGFVDGHEGQQSLSVKFYMHMSTQEGNDAGKKRWEVAASTTPLCMHVFCSRMPTAFNSTMYAP